MVPWRRDPPQGWGAAFPKWSLGGDGDKVDDGQKFTLIEKKFTILIKKLATFIKKVENGLPEVNHYKPMQTLSKVYMILPPDENN